MLNASLSWPLLSKGTTYQTNKNASGTLEVHKQDKSANSGGKNKKKSNSNNWRCIKTNTLNNPSYK